MISIYLILLISVMVIILIILTTFYFTKKRYNMSCEPQCNKCDLKCDVDCGKCNSSCPVNCDKCDSDCDVNCTKCKIQCPCPFDCLSCPITKISEWPTEGLEKMSKLTEYYWINPLTKEQLSCIMKEYQSNMSYTDYVMIISGLIKDMKDPKPNNPLDFDSISKIWGETTQDIITKCKLQY
jgi:hypothetical protein